MEFDKDITDANVLKAVPITYEEIREFAQKRCPFNHMTVAYKRCNFRLRWLSAPFIYGRL